VGRPRLSEHVAEAHVVLGAARVGRPIGDDLVVDGSRSSPAPEHRGAGIDGVKGVQVGERTADDRADRRAKPDSDPGGSHVAPVAAAEVHQRSDRQREGADGERAADDPDRERRPEAEFELGDCGERDVRAAPPARAGDDQRCPSTERVARGAPDDRESNERTELRDEEPHPGVDTRRRPERDHQVRNPGVQRYLRINTASTTAPSRRRSPWSSSVIYL